MNKLSLIRVEFIKFKRSSVLYPMILLPLFSVIFGAINFYYNQSVLTNEWISLWTQVYLFYGSFFFPCLIGIICAYSYNNEFKNGGLKLLLTSSYDFIKIIMAKLFVVVILIFIVQIYFLILYYSFGYLFNFKMAIPFGIINWVMLISLFSISMITLFMFVALVTKSFATTVIVSLLFGIISFFVVAQNIIPELGYIFAYTKIAVAMNNNYQNIYYSNMEFVYMISWVLIISLIFVYLQNINLHKKIR